MQISIIPMPPISGPINREFPITADILLRAIGSRPFEGWIPYEAVPEIVLGSKLSKAPQNLHKVIHVAHDQTAVFETVFATEAEGFRCLYTKIISNDVDIAISLASIRHYTGRREIHSLTDIVSEEYWYKRGVLDYNDIHSLIPPVYTSRLEDYTVKLLDIFTDDRKNRYLGWRFKPLYDYEPGILEALISGTFYKSPFHELRTFIPQLNIAHEKWSCFTTSHCQTRMTDGDRHVNHPEFDSIALSLLALRPSKISLTSLLSFALDGHLNLSFTRHLTDYYSGIIPYPRNEIDGLKNSLSDILMECVCKYCMIYDINHAVFGDTLTDKSSVTIEKNIYDEISIGFHDLRHDRYVNFYTSFPSLALSTMGAGRYINAG